MAREDFMSRYTKVYYEISDIESELSELATKIRRTKISKRMEKMVAQYNELDFELKRLIKKKKRLFTNELNKNIR